MVSTCPSMHTEPSGAWCSRERSTSRSVARRARYGAGETYFVPDGALHSAVIHPGYVGIDVFADADRYNAREEG